MFHHVLLVLAALVMSVPACDAQEPPKVPKEQLLKDQTYAVETVNDLANVIAPGKPWGERLFPKAGCFAANGSIKGYQTSFSVDRRSKTVGHDIDASSAIETARDWLAERGYKLVEDTHFDDGLRRILAVKEDDLDGIGISVSAHPGAVWITGTTKCRP